MITIIGVLINRRLSRQRVPPLVWTLAVALYSLQGVERKDCGEQKLQQLWLRLLPIFPLQGEDRLSWLIDDIQADDTSGAATNSQRRQTTTAGKQQKGTVIFQEQILFFISSSLTIAPIQDVLFANHKKEAWSISSSIPYNSFTGLQKTWPSWTLQSTHPTCTSSRRLHPCTSLASLQG